MASLRGHLLISAPALFDPNFRRTVVLIGDHDEDGALGVVLNRPTPVAVADAVPALAGVVDGDARVFIGGPVQPRAAIVLAELADPSLADIPVLGAIGFLVGDVDEEKAAAVRRARVFAGYAGWGPGQLDEEVARDGWIIERALADDVFATDADALWRTVARRKGGEAALLATMPFDPSTN